MSAIAPPSRDELAAVLHDASRARTHVRVTGGATASRRGRVVNTPAQPVSTLRMDRILAHEPADLTVTVEGGARVADLQRVLGERGQTWIQAGDREGATVGGLLATGTSGVRRLRYGAIRDSLLQVVLVTGDGRLVSGGGKTVKGVAGYDIPRLVVGALGTLGVIVEVTLKLWPVPPSTAWFTAEGPTAELVDVGRAVLRERHAPAAVLVRPGRLLVEIIGPPEDLTPPAGMRVCPAPEPPRFPGELLAGVPPTALPAMASRLTELGLDFQLELGVGTCRVAIADNPDIHGARAAAVALGGHAVITDAPPVLRGDPWGPPPPGLHIMRRLRDAFDPAGILNPGCFPEPLERS